MARVEDTANERPAGRMAVSAGDLAFAEDAEKAGLDQRRGGSLPRQGEAAVGGRGAALPERWPAAGVSENDARDGRATSNAEQARIGFIGKKLGRFLITSELGRGGMATVYRARDPQLGRDVAVKVMHGFFAGRAEIEARFRREANAVAAIRHASILALYDFAPPAGEEPGYIVSELIEGPGLRQFTEERGGRLLPEVMALITMRVAEALGAAHAAGIVHRDVKPDNVLIDGAGGGARVVLTDFGVAHVGGMDTMTATGAVLGSPAYMSPEQARGEEVGPASDVFSLGVLMYQLCTGHLPFGGKDPLTLITAILRGDYVRPAKIEARIGPDWECVITRCLARDPAARFPDGSAVAQALRELLTAAGLTDQQAALSRCFSAPDEFEREISPGIARLAVAAAERARRRGQIPRALSELGRALAYAPNDGVARELLERLGGRSKRLWLRTAVAGTAALAVFGAFAMARSSRLGPTPFPGQTASAVSGSRVTAVASAAHRSESTKGEASASPPGPAVLPAALGFAAVPVLPAAPDPLEGLRVVHTLSAEQRNAGTLVPSSVRPPSPAANAAAIVAPRNAMTSLKQRRKERQADVPATAPVQVGVGTHLLAKTDGSPHDPDGSGARREQTVGAVAPTAGEPEIAPTVRRVTLRASHGFCEPSLDDHPPSLRARYDDLAAGPHDIFCTLPEGRGKVHVTTYDFRPGTSPSLTIVPGADGRPVLGRPE